jgi:dephospho-CoA kinase
MTFKLGLTGSIGMGKSTTAEMFAGEGVPVWDADAAVHRLYAPGGAAVGPVGRVFPQAIVGDAVSRDKLKSIISANPDALRRIEEIVHPLVAQDRADFLSKHDTDIVLFDIPLLFETGANTWLDAVVVVTAPADIQKARVLERDGMTTEQFDLILARQMPDEEKRQKADYIIVTLTLDAARNDVRRILAEIRGAKTNA